MCGRYYIDFGLTDEIEELVHSNSRKYLYEMQQLNGDILPTNTAPVIEKTEQGLQLSICKWGFPLQNGRNLVINARTETVLDKPSFSNGIWYHRIVIPASGFYEWNKFKERSTFTRADTSALYLAGFCDWFENEQRFVILTTAANESMIKVHDRMPLILEKEQLADWFDNKKMQEILRQKPVVLKRQSEYEQLSLFS